MKIPGLAFRLPATAGVVLLSVLATSGIGDAAPMKFGQRPKDCGNWDCQGGIICSCCFFNGCWICDSNYNGTPDTDQCHWDDAAAVTKPPVTQPPRVPGGTPDRKN